MKLLFIEAIRKDLLLSKKAVETILNNLPDTLTIFYTIQYKKLAEKLREVIRNKKEIVNFKQVLGCSKLNEKNPILLIGSGRFHAIQIALSSNQIVYILEGDKINKIEKQEVDKLRKKKKGLLLRFYASKKVGILVSTKSGQENLKEALRLQKALEEKEKKSFIFITNDINLSELENFKCDIWINLACPGLFLDSNKILNAEDLKI